MPNNPDGAIQYLAIRAGFILALVTIILTVLAKSELVEWMWAVKSGFLSLAAFGFSYLMTKI